MLEVKSLIEKEKELDQNIEDNKKAVDELLCLIADFSKKKSQNIRFALCNHA